MGFLWWFFLPPHLPKSFDYTFSDNFSECQFVECIPSENWYSFLGGKFLE